MRVVSAASGSAGFGEHAIRDDDDWRRHVDYVHYNPVRHGSEARAADWPFSSFRRAVERGWYRINWGSGDLAYVAGLSRARVAAMEMAAGE